MTLDEVVALKQEMEELFREPTRAGLGLVQRSMDEGRATEFDKLVFKTPARLLPELFGNSAPSLITACIEGRRPSDSSVREALIAQGFQDKQVQPDLSVGYLAVGKNDYRAEVRLQNPDVRTALLASNIARRSNGKVRIGEYRNLTAHGHRSADDGQADLTIGMSVGHRKGPAGSLGLFLNSPAGVGIVSNSHILAWCGRARAGDAIFAPHPGDSSEPRQIGKLRNFSSLIKGDGVALDAAFAVLGTDVQHDGNLIPSGAPGCGKRIMAGEPLPLEAIGLEVAKIGRSSHVTVGQLSAFAVSPWITYSGLGEVKLTGMLEVQWRSPQKPFSISGDSGSVVYRPDTMEAIGLVVGGGVRTVEGLAEGISIVCPLTPAMQKWNLSSL
ncbi:hypothetical protein [Bradyrhizobium oligotrophicum]|uniref:hypothetical protein n=1 Tax=Bradyrhizobium oligotrophicum TaxID=44255 RepID=UPI003EC06D99